MKKKSSRSIRATQNWIQLRTTLRSFCMMFMKFFKQLGATLNMTEFSKNAQKIQALFKGTETERMLSAGIIRTILSDMIDIYFRNRSARGPGCLVFNPEDPTSSKYVTTYDLEQDLAIAQEAMDENFSGMFEQVIKVIEKEDNEDVAIVAMIHDDGMHIHLLDAIEANKRIDEASNGLIL